MRTSHSPLGSARTVAITGVAELPTEIEVSISTPFRWGVARQGALDAMGECVDVQVYGSAAALYQLLLCIPISGFLGAVMGVMSEPPPPPVDVDSLERFLGEGRLHSVMHSYTTQAIQESGVDISNSNVETMADMQMEIWLKSVGVRVVSRGTGANVQLTLDIRVRLLDLITPHQNQVFNLDVKSPVHSYQYWIRNDHEKIEAFIKDVAERVLDRLEKT